jgi:hypothetical protein
MPCTCRAHAVHMPCTCRAHAVHMLCTCCAHAVHMPCACRAHAPRAPQVRTERSAVPFCTLLEADALHRDGLDRDGADCDGSAAGSESSGATAAAVAPTLGWPLELYQVQCSEAGLSGLVGPACRAHRSTYAVEYDPESRRARPAARDELRLRARVSFSSEAAARAVLDTVGGGCRGKFRVHPPAWSRQQQACAGEGGESGASAGVVGRVRVQLQLQLRVVAAGLTAVAACLAVAPAAAATATAGIGAGAGAGAGPPAVVGLAAPSSQAGKARTGRRRGGGARAAAPDEAWGEAQSPAAAALEQGLRAMGFGAVASRCGAARGVARPSGLEHQLGEAIEWLSTLPPGELEELELEGVPGGLEEAAGGSEEALLTEPAATPARPPPTQHPGPQRTASVNPWAALLDDE